MRRGRAPSRELSGSGGRVRNVSPSRLTSVLATVLCLVLGVVFVVGWCFPALVLRVLLCFFPR